MKFLSKTENNKKYQSKIDELIKTMKNSGYLNDSKVELAIRKSPRYEFVPESFLDVAYENMPIL